MAKRIVLTGGPCSGKTSAKAVLMQRLPEMGIKPIFVPETASVLLGSGINISGTLSDPTKALKFQELVFEQQMSTEGVFEDLASMQDNALLICDRGILDGAAYMSETDFQSVLRKFAATFGDLMSMYDGVIHLVTAADGVPAFYNLDNPARYESKLEDAINVDKRLQAAWSGHPNLRIISNLNASGTPVSFGEKMDQVVAEICSILGIPMPVEDERKFLLAPNHDVPATARVIDVVQTYLIRRDPKVERRVRVWKYADGDSLFFYTEKSPKGAGGRKRFESERQITVHEYVALLAERDPTRRDVVKDRYCYALNNQYFEQDVVRGPMPLWLLEVHATDENAGVQLPDFFNVIKEVTDDPLYKNDSIAAMTCPGYN